MTFVLFCCWCIGGLPPSVGLAGNHAMLLEEGREAERFDGGLEFLCVDLDDVGIAVQT